MMCIGEPYGRGSEIEVNFASIPSQGREDEFRHHAEFDPFPQIIARHLLVSPRRLGECSVHEYRRRKSTSAVRSSPLPQGDAIAIALKLTDSPAHRTWVNGKEINLRAARAGQVRLFDLRNTFISEAPYVLHNIHIFMPNTGVGRLVRGSPKWSWAEDNYGDDTILRHLLSSLAPVLENSYRFSKLYCELIFMAINEHVANSYSSTRPADNVKIFALSARQENKAKSILMDHISGDISVAEVADACGASVDHFSRMFRATTGLPPYRWLRVQRIERAKSLLKNSNESLVEIALACGYASQSHFTRAFSSEVGISPGAWRQINQP